MDNHSEHLTSAPLTPESHSRITTVQQALHKFAGFLDAKWLFEEASMALDAGCDFKVTITCTETPRGFVVALHRHRSERLGTHSFIKLAHGEWSAEQDSPLPEAQQPNNPESA
jgi:hypothetical protein